MEAASSLKYSYIELGCRLGICFQYCRACFRSVYGMRCDVDDDLLYIYMHFDIVVVVAIAMVRNPTPCLA